MPDVARLLTSTIAAAVPRRRHRRRRSRRNRPCVSAYCTGEDGPENLGPGIFDVREFSIEDTGNERHFVVVEAIAAMPQGDAQKFIDRPGGEAIFRLWGDDQCDDDLIVEFRPDHYWVATRSRHARRGHDQRRSVG